MNTDLYIIEYQLHGERKSFIIRSKMMRNADAWHWASCDAAASEAGRAQFENRFPKRDIEL